MELQKKKFTGYQAARRYSGCKQPRKLLHPVEYFGKIQNSKEQISAFDRETPEQIYPDLGSPDKREVVARMENKKAAGEDEIVAELVKEPKEPMF